MAGGMRRSATRKGLGDKERQPVDKCATYLLNKSPYLKYDRYLSDIFYLPTLKLRQAGSLDIGDPERTAAEGVFLNQELLDQGLATIWKD